MRSDLKHTSPVISDSSPEGLAQLLQELEQRKRELAVVNAVAGVVARSPNKEDILEQALERLLEVMELEAGAIFLMEDTGDRLTRRACLGFSQDYQRTVHHIALGEHLTGQVAKTHRPVFIEDISQESQLHSMLMRREGVRSFAGIPLRSRGQLLGVMNVVSSESRRFDSPDMDLLLSVANQLAVAVDNARLFEKSAQVVMLEERNWLAREIHDTLAQGLVGLTLQLELALTQLEESKDMEAAKTSLNRALELTRENLEDARRSVMHLRGEGVTTLGLADAVHQLVREFERDTGIKTRVMTSRILDTLPVNLQEGLYRIAQEALSNVRKHSGAGLVRVSLRCRADEVRLTIRDDGVGFNPFTRAPEGHFGIIGMGERASLLGGRLDLVSRPGHGTTVRAVVPRRSASLGAEQS